MSSLAILRAGPLTTLQDQGRFGMLRYGISASGPMDRSSFAATGAMLKAAGTTGFEFTAAGLSFRSEGKLLVAVGGGEFRLSVDGRQLEWPAALTLRGGETVDITPGPAGNYGYVRLDREVDIPAVLGSRSTNVTVGLGGFKGRALRAGDVIPLGETATSSDTEHPKTSEGAVRIVWGLHAELFDSSLRVAMSETPFMVSPMLDRMGVRLEDPTGLFRDHRSLSLVSDAIVPGDIQILGDGTPIVLMLDHQPTGGYPRIATVVNADLDRFAQMRPGTEVHFRSVTLEHAR